MRIALSLMAVLVACSAPPAPKPPQSSSISAASGDSAQTTPIPSAQATPGTLGSALTCGAKVGSQQLQKLVADCNAGGSYFNRQKSLCDTSVKLSPVKCDEASLRAANLIRENELEQFNTLMQGYLLDQMVVPTVADEDTHKIYRLKVYLAKEVKDGNSVRIDTKELRFEP